MTVILKLLVRLAPLGGGKFRRKPGSLKGKLILPAAWDSPAANREVGKILGRSKRLP